MKITYLGHSCFSVEFGNRTLLFDPFIRPNPLAASIDFDALRADCILISHGHEDHLADAVDLATRTGAPVVANWEIATWLGSKGIENVLPMNFGGTRHLGAVAVKMVPALHSSTLPDGSNGGNPGGFVVSAGPDAFYYSGDTGLSLEMKLIADEFALRFAVLPVGDTFTMGAVDAARAAKLVGAPIVMGVHYNTFPPIEIDLAAAQAAFDAACVKLLLPAIGETVTV